MADEPVALTEVALFNQGRLVIEGERRVIIRSDVLMTKDLYSRMSDGERLALERSHLRISTIKAACTKK